MSVNRRKFLKSTGVTALSAAVAGKSISVAAQTKSAAKSAAQASPAGKEKMEPIKPAQPAHVKLKPKTGKRKVLTDNAPKPAGPYSQAIISGNTVYVAGQAPIDPKTGKIEAATFEGQAVQVFENIKAILEAAGSSLAKVLRVNVYLADLEDFAKMNEVYRRYFTGDFPARTTVGAQLLLKMLIEVDCIAAL